MAKITRSLGDIEKLVKKANQSPQEQLKEVQERLKYLNIKKGFNNLEYYNKNGTAAERPEQEEYKTLKEAEKILLEQIEQEENKKELDQIKLNERLEKQTKKEIQAELYSNLKANFDLCKQNQYLLAYDLMHEPAVIDDEIKKITDIYGIEFKDYTLSIYIKTLDQVYQLYRYQVKKQQQIIKQEQSRTTKKLKNALGVNLAISAALKLCDIKRKLK